MIAAVIRASVRGRFFVLIAAAALLLAGVWAVRTTAVDALPDLSDVQVVIRTGRRTLVMLAESGGRYRPAQVQVGRESGDRTEILAGLRRGEQVVASGQFLLDSEASLAGVQARPVSSAAPASATPALVEAVGRIERLDARSITLSHQPVPALQWPAMTMSFSLADPMLAGSLKVGDQVRFAFDQVGSAHTVRRIAKMDAAR